MSLSQLDPTVALIVIDMQKGVVAFPTAHALGEVVTNVARLARAFRKRRLPVVLVNVTGNVLGRTEISFNFTPQPNWTELIPELNQQPGDYTVTKTNVGAFYGTALERILHSRGVEQVVLVGIATSIGVEATARQAYDHGYNVVLVIDAMTDFDPDMHRHTVEKVFPRIGETASTTDVLSKMNAGS